jgi:hypothetical protein
LRFVHADIKQGGLGCGVFAQLGHIVQRVFGGLLLLALISALGLIALPLLPCLFLLALCKR